MAISGLSAANSRRSPGSTSISAFRAAHSSSVKNFLMGLFSWPSVVNATQAMPLAPLASAMLASFSTSPRDQSPAPLTLMAFTTPPDWATLANTLKPVSFTMSVMSWSSMPKRTSGRSQPYRRMASAYCIFCSGKATSVTPTAFKVSAMTPSIMSHTSSPSTKDISISTWVNSGWRSARRSSSRKHRAIW